MLVRNHALKIDLISMTNYGTTEALQVCDHKNWSLFTMSAKVERSHDRTTTFGPCNTNKVVQISRDKGFPFWTIYTVTYYMLGMDVWRPLLPNPA